MPTKGEGQKVNGEHVRDLFFTKDKTDANSWTYRCGKKRRVTGTGFTKFLNHVQHIHPNDFQAILSESSGNPGRRS